ncbi:hypothetical protein TWF506_006191 [Arthrobotrys conoides]|uniref:Pyridoxal phosphate-dependent transferase n=1 Tax=Arthrobotrys conoides TaxID=74498 RepID=A0AAN8NT05_9PEZI
MFLSQHPTKLSRNIVSFLPDEQKSTIFLKEFEPLELKQTNISVTEISELENQNIQAGTPELTESFSKIVIRRDILKIFEDSQPRWIDDPVINQWRDPKHSVYSTLFDLDQLHQRWSAAPRKPFCPRIDPLWVEIGSLMAELGLPWHNNELNMPDEIDTTWPFHFKSFESRVIREKGLRVGNEDASGYVANSYEANCYCLRALQQELRSTSPSFRPLVIYDKFDEKVIQSAKLLFGLPVHRVNLLQPVELILQELGMAPDMSNQRPVIYAATLANTDGEFDDLQKICELSRKIPMLLHIDATRNFDYITTLSEQDRKSLGIEVLKLATKDLTAHLQLEDASIVCSTIVAGGTNYTSPAMTVALKPASLGESSAGRVSYVRGTDSTLAGSRDALSSLWMGLQEIRFGSMGLQEIYRRSADMRTSLLQSLTTAGRPAISSRYSLDITITSCSNQEEAKLVAVGGVLTGPGKVLITMQPSATSEDLNAVVTLLTGSPGSIQITPVKDLDIRFRVPETIITEISTTVESWQILGRSNAGYPLNQSSYSALGPVIGQFLDIKIPDDWLRARQQEIIASRMMDFGLATLEDRSRFVGAFTNGSTMGNRVGIHAALARLTAPGAFVYFSAESHYSVIKTIRDCDDLTNIWSKHKARYSQISCDTYGRMSAKALVKQALKDRQDCLRSGEISSRNQYRMILLLNTGTTFLGGRDDLQEIFRCLKDVDLTISHIHVDGALDFGFRQTYGFNLGQPGEVDSHGVPFVQGITISHHKAMGHMVSGEIICLNPDPEERLSLLGWEIDPRIVFETWLYSQIFSLEDINKLFQYCQQNASRLVSKLEKLGIATKQNEGSLIVVLERPPSWIVEEFALRPEGDWVHFITMPHISPELIDLFVERLSSLKQQYLTAFMHVHSSLTTVLQKPIKLKRLQNQDLIAKSVIQRLVNSATVRFDEKLVTSVSSGIRGATSVAIVDRSDQVEAVLVIESNRDTSITAGACLVMSNVNQAINPTAIVHLAKLLTNSLARYMNVNLKVNDSSYNLHYA